MSVTIKINEESKAGKPLLELARLLSVNSDGIRIESEPSDSYNPEFVEKILNTHNEKSIEIKTEELWESI